MGEVGRVQKWIRSGTTESYQNEYRLSEWVHYWVSIESHHDGLLINIAPRVSSAITYPYVKLLASRLAMNGERTVQDRPFRLIRTVRQSLLSCRGTGSHLRRIGRRS